MADISKGIAINNIHNRFNMSIGNASVYSSVLYDEEIQKQLYECYEKMENDFWVSLYDAKHLRLLNISEQGWCGSKFRLIEHLLILYGTKNEILHNAVKEYLIDFFKVLPDDFTHVKIVLEFFIDLIVSKELDYVKGIKNND